MYRGHINGLEEEPMFTKKATDDDVLLNYSRTLINYATSWILWVLITSKVTINMGEAWLPHGCLFFNLPSG